jgi:hypothetical protein
LDSFNKQLPPLAPKFCCQYIGVILDEESRQKLLQLHPPARSRVRGHHVTLCHVGESESPSDSLTTPLPLGEICEVKVYGEVQDPNCQGLVIEVSSTVTPLDHPLQGHITVSHDQSVTPKYTKKLLENREGGQHIEYRLRDESDPLTLRGVVSACISKDKQIDFCSSPVDFWNIHQALLAHDPSTRYVLKNPNPTDMKSRKKCSRFEFDYVPTEARKVYIFDLDDTLFQSPNAADYKLKTGITWRKPKATNGRHIGGWFCNEDSLDLSFSYPVCRGLVELFDRVGELNSVVIVMTGRPEELRSKVQDLLGSRSILSHLDAVVCKPMIRENTSDFKAEFLVDLCRQCSQLKLIEIWDDKIENLTAMEESFTQNDFQNIEIVSHLVSPFEEESTVTGDALVEWAERNNVVQTRKQSQSRQHAIDAIRTCWTEICEQLRARSDTVLDNVERESELIHIFGSHIFERASDVDLIVLVPRDVVGSLATNCQWMKLLELKLVQFGKSCVAGFEVSSYCGITGTVPKMSLKFQLDDLPSVEVDVIGLITDSLVMLNSEIRLSDALGWSIDELTRRAGQVSSGDHSVLYGISVRNFCVSALEKAFVTHRQFGCLLGIARRLMDRAFAMGTIRCGMRPYLLATTLAQAVSFFGHTSDSDPYPTLSLSAILLRWMSMHSSSLSEFKITIESLKALYPGGTIADPHLHRIIKSLHSVNTILSQQQHTSPETSLIVCLDTLQLPNQSEFRTVSIQMLSTDSNSESGHHFSGVNVLYGILSKYFGRMIRDGHDIISSPSVHHLRMTKGTKGEGKAEGVEIACFGISRLSAEVFEFVFGSVCKDFEMHQRNRKLLLEICE